MPPHTDLSRVTIVSVCYNSTKVLPAMLQSCAGTPIILVDNASSDAGVLVDLANTYKARLIHNAENFGFGVACNIGAKNARTDFLFFLNPDAMIRPDTIDELIKAAEKYPQASAFNPRITDDDGAQFFRRGGILTPTSEKMPRGWPSEDCEINVLSGAALFIRRSQFEAVGGFDPNIFLFHEDDDLSYRLRNDHGPIRFVRSAIVAHQGGNSSGASVETSSIKARYLARSRIYVARKHGKRMPFVFTFLKAVKQFRKPSVLFSTSQRRATFAFLQGALSTLQDGGRGKGA
ncbi:glycosyltransferase family 2 protein [Thioclava sp. A2]|uniref:glycosyltransferase family 2 protein n=1 Tax=Thioclava sp. FCG-A2 TaxID=3080562 RepID=UPI0029532664|nr:glycosyltransferase family 2 protein [Thioclava sp. A2]MDV7271909.1 glycosyltransferase family 2 protein [Thioclava sp. A2]